MSELVKNLIKRFEYNRKHKKNYLLMLLVMAVIMAGAVTWGLKLTGVSVTAEDTEVADALETYGLLQGASPEEGTQETESTEVSQEETKQEPETSQIEDTQKTTEASTEQTEDTEAEEEDPSFELDADAVDGITVTVSGDRSSLPYPADELEVKAEEVTDEDVVSLCDQLMEENEVNADKQYLLSLSLYHGEDEVEPTGNVTVTFSGLDTENYEPSVYSIDTETEDAEDMDAEADEDGDVAVETEQFSVFAVSVNAVDESSYTEIANVDDLTKILKNGGHGKLTNNIEINNTLFNENIATLDLNGYKISYKNANNNCISVTSGTLTVEDNNISNISKDEIEENVAGDRYNRLANLVYQSDTKIPKELEYYVTKSSPNGTGTTDSLDKYTRKFVTEKMGCIEISETSDLGVRSVVWVKNGASFILNSGVLTTKSSKSYIVSNDGTMEIGSNGYICGSKIGGIHSSGTLNMNGGAVVGNTGNCGGGIDVSGGTFTMNGGAIAGNSGSGVYIENKATFKLVDNAVIAANNADRGGGVYVKQGTFEMSGGIITGNFTNKTQLVNSEEKYNNALGGGIFSDGATVTINDGYITNNAQLYTDAKYEGFGCHGGGGLAAIGGTLTVNDGKITGNYSEEAGGGLYVGHFDQKDSPVKFKMNGGIIASNYAKVAEGGGLRIGGGTTGEINPTENVVYITNNRTATENDWGGGGIFVQTDGTLKMQNSLITNNTAECFGGGIGACPTGQSLLVHESDKIGSAVYGNTANGLWNHLSKGTGKKEADKTIGFGTDGDVEPTDKTVFRQNKYNDYFCVTDHTDGKYISLVTGKMLGGGVANWEGSCDQQPITISKNGYAAAKQIIGLGADPSEQDKKSAVDNAMVVISGNWSNTHGGGIMTNGNLLLGNPDNITTDTSFNITGTKNVIVNGKNATTGRDFNFELLDENNTVVGEAVSDGETGVFTISPNRQYLNEKTYTYFLQEKKDKSGVIYDKTKYKITVKIKKYSLSICGVTFENYRVENASIMKLDDTTENTFTVYYHKPENWGDNVYMHLWYPSGEANKVLGTASGNSLDTKLSMTNIGQGWYKITFNDVKENGRFQCLFHNGNGTKTDDYSSQLATPGGEIWYNGKSVETIPPADWSTDLYNGKTNADGSYSLTINGAAFTNEKLQYELPATGGTGTIKFTIGGLLIVAGSLWYGYSMKRRRERRAG